MKPIIKKCAISVPNEAYVLPEAFENQTLLAFHMGKLEGQWEKEKRPIQYEFHRYTTGRLMTAMAREQLVKVALLDGMDYILMVDSDMLCPINMVEWLLEDMEKRPEIDILAPLAFMRNPPHYAVIYTTTEGYDQENHQAYFVNNFVKNYPKDTLVECDAVGFGAVLIKMDIVRKMKAPYFFSTTGSGEDIYFCMKARQEAGARVFMDTRVKLGHIGRNIVVDEEYYLNWIKENKHEIPDVPHKYLTETR